MIRHCFLAKEASEYPAWRQAFPNFILCSEPEKLSGETIDAIWIFSTIENWEPLVQQYQEQSKRVIVLSSQPNIEEAFKAFSAGARGYGHAWASPIILQQMDSVTAQDGLWVGPDLFKGLMQLSQTVKKPSPTFNTGQTSALSDREQEVAEQVVLGLTNKEIARKLSITERTVKAHLGAIFRKLNVRDRIQLVLHFKTS